MLMAKLPNPPSWATLNQETGFYEVDPDVVYPMYLEKLGITEITQHALELARRCFTKDLHQGIKGILRIRILKKPRWALIKYPVGIPFNFSEMYARMRR